VGEIADISFLLLVGERGFEPPTPWSRIGCGVGVSLWGSEVLGQMHRGKRVGLSSGSSEFPEKMRLGDS